MKLVIKFIIILNYLLLYNLNKAEKELEIEEV